MARKSRPPLSLGDPWIPILTAIHSRSERLTGRRSSDSRAAGDVRNDLRNKKLLAMRRNDATGKCEFVPHTFWDDHEIDVRLGVEIYRGPRGPYGYDPHSRINGWLYYVCEWPQPTVRRRRRQTRTGKVSLKREMTRAIIKRNNPGGWGGVSSDTLVKQVKDEWAAECKTRGLSQKEYKAYGRRGMETAIGRRSG
jgi:hypothetical protein